MKNEFPWAQLKMPVYIDTNIKSHKKWVINGSWMFTFFLILGGIMTPYKISFVFAFLYILALIMKKTMAVTQRGFETFYDMKIIKHHEIWDWHSIEAVTYEFNNAYPKIVLLYFTKGVKTRKAFFDKSYKDNIIKLALTNNPNIKIYDGKQFRENITSKKAN